MSDVNTSTEGTSVPTNPPKKNLYKETIAANCTAFKNANENGTACYLGGTEKDGVIVIETKKPITNAINGQRIKGTNQLLIQNAFKSAGIKDREVLVHDQAEKYGIHFKKGSPFVNITIQPHKDKEGNWLPNVIREVPVSSSFVFDENNKPKSPAPTIALAKLNSERFDKIQKNRAIAHKEQTSVEKAEKLWENNAWEHRKQIDFLLETGGNVQEYMTKSVQPKEAEYLAKIDAENPERPTLGQQKGRAYKEVQRLENYRKEHATETPVIDATNTVNPVDYIGKYMAACELRAEFKTDKHSQEEVRNRLDQTLQQNIDSNNYDSFFTLGAEIDERAKAIITDFRNMSNEQQRGITPERAVVHERPEQTVDAITF